MATVAASIDAVKTFGDRAHVITWTPLTTADADGGAIEMPGSADRSVQFTGTFGVGGTIILQGSNVAAPVAGTDADWATLTDPQGNAISKTAAALEAVSELTRWIRAKVTAGDGTTSITARLLVKRNV